MVTKFEVREITTHPQDTGVSQYINMEVEIIQFFSQDVYAKSMDTEIYSGEGIGLI